jgi:hypothetical protein
MLHPCCAKGGPPAGNGTPLAPCLRRAQAFATLGLKSVWRLFFFTLVIIGFFSPMAAHSNQPGDGDNKGLISASQAMAEARVGLYAAPWIHFIKPSVDIGTLAAAQPLLVQWMDRKDTFYYLVPFNLKDQTIIVVIIDAITGRFKECSELRQPGIYPKVNASRAEKIILTHLQAQKPNVSSPTAPPHLVWKPCEQTQSPYEPLWCIQIDSTHWFIDQNGKIHPRITEIQMKGAGPP